MPELILGLDIGRSAVKAVLASPLGRGEVRVMACQAESLREGTDLEEALGHIAGKIQSAAAPVRRCVVLLSPADVMFRHVSLPFRDEGKIRKTLPFELEPLLPVPVEEVVADYLPLPDGGLMAAAVSKEKIRTILAAVEAHLGPVAVIDVAPAALVLPLLEQKTLTGSGIVLDVGKTSTCAAFYESHALVLIRAFAFGGDTITEALAGDLSCSFEEAEKIKIQGSTDGRSGRASEACRAFSELLAGTVEFLQINSILHEGPGRIYLTGGGSLYGELAVSLGQKFGVPVEDLESVRPGRPVLDENVKSRYSAPAMSQALAAVNRIQASGKSFNFRQGEFAVRSIASDLSRRWKRAAVVAAVLVLLAAVDTGLGYFLQARQAADLKKSINRIFYRHFPPQTVMVDPTGQLQKKLTDDRKAYGLEDGGSGVPVMNLLTDLSESISPALEVVLTQLHYEKNVVLVKGEAKKVEDVTQMQKALLKAKTVQNVTVGSTALAQDKAKVNFDLRIELR